MFIRFQGLLKGALIFGELRCWCWRRVCGMRGCGLDGGGRGLSLIGGAEEKEMSIGKGYSPKY